MTMQRSVVLGCGSYLPKRVLTNAELATTVDTSDEWIVQRTGIHERRVAAPGEVTSDLGLHAARAALAAAKMASSTTTPAAREPAARWMPKASAMPAAANAKVATR